MEKLRLFLISLVVIILAAGLLVSGCSSGKASKLKVVTGSSLLSYIVQQVAGNKVDVVNLVPPAQHPGDFNVKPTDIQTLASASLFLLQGWPGEGYADKLIASANNPNLTVVKANVDGNWMIPSVQLVATDRVASILGQADSTSASTYQKSADEYKQRVQKKESDIKARLASANVLQVNVIASDRQADFLQWAGFNVVATYGAPESLTPQVVKDLVDKGRAAKVTLVVDNLQSGKDAGKGLAEELGAKNVNLSNFPGGLDNTETWEKAIDRNIELLLGAVAK
jgi:zinc transport system substrate-binding protein